MLTQYIAAAMRKAKYEVLAEDGTYYGKIPGFEGVWANTSSLEACREELAEVLEEWVRLRPDSGILFLKSNNIND